MAVLDCPGGWSFEGSGTDFFPARVTQSVDILKRPAIHEEVIVLGWEVGREGHRLHANTAIVGLNGDPYAVCAQTCYAVPSDWAT